MSFNIPLNQDITKSTENLSSLTKHPILSHSSLYTIDTMYNDLKLNIKMTSPQNILDKIRTASKSTFTKRLRKNKDIPSKHIRKTF